MKDAERTSGNGVIISGLAATQSGLRMVLRCMLVCVLLFAGIMMLSACGRDSRAYPLGNRIRNCGEIVRSIRHGLKGHASSIEIQFDYGSDIYDELNDVLNDWVEVALEETDQPDEGDYIRYQYGGYTMNSKYSVRDNRWYYTVTLVPEYYDYLTQEQEAAEEAARLLKSFRFGYRTPDAEKVRTIYDYICRTVRYDKVHQKHRYYHKCSTAYAALIQHQATCQGYCTALYRLLRSSGVNCRIVTGKAVPEYGDDPAAETEGLHAWVIAEIGGIYYNLDPTWDAGRDEYRYFLVGGDHFSGHTPGEKFREEAFISQHPAAEKDFENSIE